MGTRRWLRSVAIGLATATGGGLVGAACVPPPLPVARVADVRAPEQGGSAAFAVVLSSAAPGPVTVSYATAPGTATAPADFRTTSGTLSFAAGQTSRAVSVPVTNDALDEDEEAFRLDLSAPSGATIGDGSGTATVVDDDPPVTVRFPDALGVGEGNGGPSGGETAWWDIVLSAPSGRQVSVRFTTSDGWLSHFFPATAPADYAATSAYVSFPPGTTSVRVGVPIVGDTLDEADELFTATLSDPTNAFIWNVDGFPSYAGIVDDDAPPSVVISDASAPERTGALGFRVRLSAPSGRATSVAYTTRDGSAEEGADYDATSGTLRWTAGTTTEWTVSVPVSPDSCREADESLFLDLGGAENLAVPDPSGQGIIADDDLFTC